MKNRAWLLTLLLAVALPIGGPCAEISNDSIVSFFEGLGVSSEVKYNSVVRSPFGAAVQGQNLNLFEVKVGTPAWKELGLPREILPEPWPTPVEYKVSQLGRQVYSFMSKLTPKQREVLKARLKRGDEPREVEELARLLQDYIIPMGKARGADGNTHAALYPEDFKAFNDQALAVVAGIPEEEDPAAPAPQPAKKAPVRTTEEVLRAAKSRAQVQQGLLGARQMLGSMLSSGQSAAASQLAAKQAAGANQEEIRQLQANVQFLSWLNGPKTQAALRADPEKSKQLQQLVSAIDDITKPGAAGKTVRQKALYPLVKFIHESQLTEDQWKGLIDKFPMGDSINRLGWAKLWRMGIDGRLPDGTEMTAGLIGSGVDERHPLLAGKVTHSANLTHERRLSPDGIPVPDPRGSHETSVASVIISALPGAHINDYKNLEDRKNMPPWRRMTNDSQYGASVASAVDAARRDGVAAINLSQGTSVGFGQTLPEQMRDAAGRARRDGIPVDTSSGNEGPGTQNLPAAISFSVGSLDADDNPSDFSSEADAVIMGPDGKVRLQTTPQIMAPGEFVMAKVDPSGKYDDPDKLYEPSQGTSFSSPWVTAAMLALEQVARQHGVKVSPAEKEEILMKTGSRIDMPLHPMGVPSLNPVAAVEELQRRIALRSPAVAQANDPARDAARRDAMDIFSPTRLVARLVRGMSAATP